jgi:hypothetical protein
MAQRAFWKNTKNTIDIVEPSKSKILERLKEALRINQEKP